jgi:hypothetical protein
MKPSQEPTLLPWCRLLDCASAPWALANAAEQPSADAEVAVAVPSLLVRPGALLASKAVLLALVVVVVGKLVSLKLLLEGQGRLPLNSGCPDHMVLP